MQRTSNTRVKSSQRTPLCGQGPGSQNSGDARGAYPPIAQTNMKHTVLFLDIDGPLHPAGACGPMPDGTVFGEDLFRWVGPLLGLLEELPHVNVVLHSSWRYAYGGDLRRLLEDLPPALASRVVGVTPLKVQGRQESIEAYVRRHQVEHFAAVDDAGHHFADNLPWLVLCGSDGLSSPETVDALRARLQA